MQHKLTNHPDRIRLANELHARPFALVKMPFRVSHIAFACGPEMRAAVQDHLIALCDRFGALHPAADTPQIMLDLGRFRLKWEWHTEFVALSVFAGPASPAHEPFSDPATNLLPAGWLDGIKGDVLAAIHIHGESADDLGPAALPDHLKPHFSDQSLVGGSFFEDTARFWGDFRLHEDGFMRFAVRSVPDFEPALLGRIVQRLAEVETYRALSMMALPAARGVWPKLNEIDAALARITSAVGEGSMSSERVMLDQITDLSAEIETITSENAYRLDASRAYAAIVWRRIEVLSATPLRGKIDLKGFMMRRYDPAMRSCEATRARLESLSERAGRAAHLLRTRIDVTLEEQNRAVLASMNERSARQLRLQETVEGLSVVAISYYAVSLAALLFGPLAKVLGLSATVAKAVLVLPIMGLVWLFVQRIKRHALAASEADNAANENSGDKQ